MKLHLGVIDFPHPNSRGTTGDVAEILEDEYHIMATFFAEHAPQIIALIEGAFVDALEDLIAGAPPVVKMSAAAESAIEAMFRAWLSSRGMDGMPGVPTEAAMKGVNHRRLHPYAKGNPSRPSFIDTGTYVAAFKAWMSETGPL